MPYNESVPMWAALYLSGGCWCVEPLICNTEQEAADLALRSSERHRGKSFVARIESMVSITHAFETHRLPKPIVKVGYLE